MDARAFAQFLGHLRLDHFRRHEGREDLSGRRAGDGKDRAGAHVHVHLVAALLHLHDGGAVGAPYGDGDHEADLFREIDDGLACETQGIEASQPRDAELQGKGTELIAPARRILLHELELAEAHQIGMGLGRRHVRHGREFAQHQGLSGIDQRRENPASDLDRLYAASVYTHRLPNIVGPRRIMRRCGTPRDTPRGPWDRGGAAALFPTV